MDCRIEISHDFHGRLQFRAGICGVEFLRTADSGRDLLEPDAVERAPWQETLVFRNAQQPGLLQLYDYTFERCRGQADL